MNNKNIEGIEIEALEVEKVRRLMKTAHAFWNRVSIPDCLVVLERGGPWVKVRNDVPELGLRSGDFLDFKVESYPLPYPEREAIHKSFFLGIGIIGELSGKRYLFLRESPSVVVLTPNAIVPFPEYTATLPPYWRDYLVITGKETSLASLKKLQNVR